MHPGDETSAAIQVSSLVKRYGGRAVVDDLTFAVERGEVFALLGPNGAGKTTTVEILEGYRAPDGGTARVLGLDPSRDGARLKPRLGLMLQQGGVYPQLKVREALDLFAGFYDAPERPEEIIERLGLRDVAKSRFRHLSGGEKQRVSLGLALIGKPEVVFLDEPTAAMDPFGRRQTWEVIRSLKERGATVLLTTHFMDEAEHLADRVAIVDHGKLVALDTPLGLRGHATSQLRFSTNPALTVEQAAQALGLEPAEIQGDHTGIVAAVQPTPARIARLAAWLAERDIQLTSLESGSRSLEQAFLALTSSEQPS